MTEEKLAGGFAHPGQVVRVGDTVRRPPSKHRSAINALLDHVNATGLVEVPVPLGLDEQGRETFSFIAGDVPILPYPAWAVSDASLRSIAELLRRFHEVASSFEIPAWAEWPTDLADPAGGDQVCHNDMCLENVVFREGQAVGLLDFDFAAPGRCMYDVAMTLRLCGGTRNVSESFGRVDPLHRLSVFCHAYGVAPSEREEIVEGLLSSCAVGREFVRRRAEAGEPWFRDVWAAGGVRRFERDEMWIRENAARIIEGSM